MDLEQKKQQCGVWAKKVESACEEDKWGHVLDASDQYQQASQSNTLFTRCSLHLKKQVVA